MLTSQPRQDPAKEFSKEWEEQSQRADNNGIWGQTDSQLPWNRGGGRSSQGWTTGERRKSREVATQGEQGREEDGLDSRDRRGGRAAGSCWRTACLGRWGQWGLWGLQHVCLWFGGLGAEQELRRSKGSGADRKHGSGCSLKVDPNQPARRLNSQRSAKRPEHSPPGNAYCITQHFETCKTDK